MDKKELALLENALIVDAYFEECGGEDGEGIVDITKKLMSDMDDIEMAREVLYRYYVYDRNYELSNELKEKYADTADQKFDIFKKITKDDTFLYDYINRDCVYPSYFVTNFFHEEEFLQFDVFNSQQMRNPLVSFLNNIYKIGDVFLIFNHEGAKILDINGQDLVTVIIDKKGLMSFEDNKSKFDVINPKDTNPAIYYKDYLDSLQDEAPDPDKMVAVLKWNYCFQGTEYGITEVALKEPIKDPDLLIALSIVPYIHSFK